MLGKIWAIILLMIPMGADAYIILEATSFDGRKITEVVVGEPFVLKISTDEVDQVHDIHIDGLQAFTAQKTGLSLITINGKKTAQVTYQAQANKPGAFTLGPALVPNGQSPSATVVLKVHAERITTAATVKEGKDGQGHVMLRIAIDNDTVFVGQKIKTRLRAYVPEDEDISIDQVISNDPATIEFTKKTGPTKGTKVMHGKNYTFFEWQWDMYPKESGTIVVPAYFVDYAKALPAQQGFGGFAMFFGPRYERKRVYSNALSLHIKALPTSSEPIDAVGAYTSFHAEIRPSVAKKYEGMVLVLTVEGEGNMAALQEPALVGLPDAFKHYFSKSEILPGTSGQQKRFEYIVQGMQEGEWQIPAQMFRFFDVKSGSYKELESSPLSVTIVAEQAVVASPVQEPNSLDVADVAAQDVQTFERISEDVLPMEGALSYGLFLFLLSIPLGVLGVVKLLRSTWLIQKLFPHYVKRRAFARAHKELARAYRQHNVGAIHGIFMQVIAHVVAPLDDAAINDIIEKSILSEPQKESWHMFYEKISQAAYADNTRTKEVVRLFHEATQWLKDLERIV